MEHEREEDRNHENTKTEHEQGDRGPEWRGTEYELGEDRWRGTEYDQGEERAEYEQGEDRWRGTEYEQSEERAGVGQNMSWGRIDGEGQNMSRVSKGQG